VFRPEPPSTVTHSDRTLEFSIQGGPLHRLALRSGLARHDLKDTAFGLALGGALWAVLVALALAQGYGSDLLSLNAWGAHVRLLLVIPLFFVCEVVVDARMREFSRTIVQSNVVPPTAVPALRSEIARCARWRDSWWPESACLVLVVLGSLIWPREAYGSGTDIGQGTSWASQWYWTLCLPAYRFLLLRWLWRIGLWTWFLWRLSRLPLQLVPTHPDGAAGLGYVEVVQAHFGALVLAISAPLAVSLAEAVVMGTMSAESVFAAIGLVLVIDCVLFLGPTLVFVPVLWACRVKGLAEYTELAQRYVASFDRKWLQDGPDEVLRSNNDLQSIAAIRDCVATVRGMRIAPSSMRLLLEVALAAVAPMVPLLLINYPIGHILMMLVTKLLGQ
jgi:hypothetical protein